ncbi:preprotein translocase subunit SecE [Candidatus Peregrinibacteria bacterium HGW-Peregrinibacteria-1]|jgi:preprotein translocase subunit SecE|nr:MAG: preprotein translocase subunit SecE [Candidatus Peregrinibacteria bacterium HGW-Peregrinibacteria-1]
MKETKSNQLVSYLKGSLEELRRVSWPTKNQAVKMTIIVLIFCGLTVLALTGIDYLFNLFFNFIK